MTFINSMKYLSGAFIGIGVVSLYIQNNYYGYVDEQGILRDSLLLPIGAFSLVLGAVCLTAFLASVLVKTYRSGVQ